MKEVFQPRSRLENEVKITKNQNDFSAGMIQDVPASLIPEQGLAELDNIIDYGDRLTTRTGTKQWSTTILPSLRTGYNVTSTVTGTTRTVVWVSGTTFTADDIGNFFVFADGTHERIRTNADTHTITTETDVTTAKNTTTGYIRGAINCIYYHKVLKKIVILIGTKIYISDAVTISSWTQAYSCSSVDPSNFISSAQEYNNCVFIFNSNGIFKLDLTAAPYSFYKCNSANPTTRIIDSIPTTAQLAADSTLDDYKYRYIYSYSRFDGTSVLGDRQTSGALYTQESGINDLDLKLVDYATVYKNTDIGIVSTGSTIPNSVSLTLYAPTDYHWTHYSLYRTKDVGINGQDTITGAGNFDTQFFWVKDIPIVKAFKLTKTVYSGSTYKVARSDSNGGFNQHDTGATIKVSNGDSLVIQQVYPVTTSTLYYDNTLYQNTLTLTVGSGLFTDLAGCIGATDCFIGDQSGTTVTAPTTRFLLVDINKTLFWADGTTSLITSVASDNSATCTVLDSNTRSSMACAYNPTNRSITDYNPDSIIEASGTSYPVNNRFWQPLPQCNLGSIAFGFMLTCARDDNYLYYSQISQGFEYWMGYYYPGLQQNIFKDSIRAIWETIDNFVIYGSLSTYIIPATMIIENRDDISGTNTLVLSGQTIVDPNIGCLDSGSIQDIDLGKQILITNEPAVRIFDGRKKQYSESLSEDKISDLLRTLETFTSSSYDPWNGYIFWGLIE
jgi:hypothetical protein